MNMEELLEKLDHAFEAGDTRLAESIITGGIRECVEINDNGALLQLLNEYLGFLRETGRAEESYEIAEKILGLAEGMGLAGSIPYATCLLNVANAYRAGGRLSDSLACYEQVKTIYEQALPADSMLFASYYNNLSLLHQEMGSMESSVSCLEQALKIVEAKGEGFEIAVTHANLASSYAGMGDYVRAKEQAKQAKQLFEERNTLDAHYAASLYVLGICAKKINDKAAAVNYLSRAMSIMEENLGRNEFYYRIRDALESVGTAGLSGLDICRDYYREIVAPAIKEEFPQYVDRIAAGLVGRGSDCYGYDDEISRDHDWGPGCLLFVTRETYAEIGEALSEMYEGLPAEFKGFGRGVTVSKNKRRGVFVIEEFYEDLLGAAIPEGQDFLGIQDYALSTAVNGEIFTDPEGIFTEYRERLKKGYPEDVRFLKMAQSAASFSQCAQYNCNRFMERGDMFTASIMLSDGLKEAMKLAHYLENKYPPHDKWLKRSCVELNMGDVLVPLLEEAMANRDVSALAAFFADKMYREGFISDSDDYLDHHTEELVIKAKYSKQSNEEMADSIARLEFEAFDKVQNEGGRAGCQDDWGTFEKMRKSQYLTWNRQMLLQYLYDFERELSYGHNLITEKYGRMMENTAPERYAAIKDNFPVISPEKKQIIEAVVGIQVGWMEHFAAQYPKLARNARTIHSVDDSAYDTSYETYLRGEISTYSDKMLELYARFVAETAGANKNLSYLTMEHSVHMYGYGSLEEAEASFVY